MNPLKIILSLIAAAALSACSTTGTVDKAALEAKLNKAESLYHRASILLDTWCIAAPTQPPCNSPGAMSDIARGKAILAAEWPGLRRDLLAATTEDAVTVAENAILRAISIYTSVLATYGVKG